MTPILRTSRLLLREFDEADAGFIRQLLNEPSWIANIGDRQIDSDEAARGYIRSRLCDNYRRLGFGFWAVQRQAEGDLIGMCGLTRRETLPEPDIGYALLPAHWGRGYAREAAAATLQHAHRVLGLNTLLAITAPHNQASMAVLQAIGMRPDDPPRRPHDDGSESCVFVWRAPAVATPPT